MDHPLDRPIWRALTTHHAHLAQGGGLARRYPAEFAPFAATADTSAASFAELHALIPPGGIVAIIAVDRITTPGELEVVMATTFDQMIATSMDTPVAVPALVSLGEADLPAMMALAELITPNPFAARTHELGSFLGVRLGGRLVAMAGERLRLLGFTEIGSVCTLPDHRRRGYGSALVASLSRVILDRGEIPFLHVHNSNRHAIAVYRRLGFTFRCTMHLAVLRHPSPRTATKSRSPLPTARLADRAPE